jgi:hypothetical protein
MRRVSLRAVRRRLLSALSVMVVGTTATLAVAAPAHARSEHDIAVYGTYDVQNDGYFCGDFQFGPFTRGMNHTNKTSLVVGGSRISCDGGFVFVYVYVTLLPNDRARFQGRVDEYATASSTPNTKWEPVVEIGPGEPRETIDISTPMVNNWYRGMFVEHYAS